MDGLGELLKSERLSTKTSVKEISSRTNISEKMIDALENNDYSKIPGKFYMKNFIINYLTAAGIDHKNFLLKYKEQINKIPFNVDNKSDYLYKMRYSKFEKKGVIIKFLILVFILAGGYYIINENFDKIKKFLTPDEVKVVKIKTIPQTGLHLENIPDLLSFGHNNIKNNSKIFDEQLGFSTDIWAVDLVIIINKKNWITVFQNGKKIIGRDYKQGEVIELKGYSFSLHTQFASAIDVLVNGESIKYFKDKKGYQKLMITPGIMEIK